MSSDEEYKTFLIKQMLNGWFEQVKRNEEINDKPKDEYQITPLNLTFQPTQITTTTSTVFKKCGKCNRLKFVNEKCEYCGNFF